MWPISLSRSCRLVGSLGVWIQLCSGQVCRVILVVVWDQMQGCHPFLISHERDTVRHEYTDQKTVWFAIVCCNTSCWWMCCRFSMPCLGYAQKCWSVIHTHCTPSVAKSKCYSHNIVWCENKPDDLLYETEKKKKNSLVHSLQYRQKQQQKLISDWNVRLWLFFCGTKFFMVINSVSSC